MLRRRLAQLATVGLLIATAGILVIRAIRGAPRPGERAFFYDLSAQKLFTASRTAVAPIRGIDGPEEDAVRAVVFSPTGQPRNRGTWQVAYLEKLTPDLKRLTEEAQRTGEPLAMGRIVAQAHRFVRRLPDPQWHPMNTPEAEAILTGWATPGPGGATPVVCTPD